VASGDSVGEGDEIMVMEAMKMEMPVKATVAGTVTINVAAGDRVDTGEALATIS
jgi:biotin carboxyl carrier protein